MKRKWIIGLAVGVPLLGVCALSLLTIFGTFQWVQASGVRIRAFRFFNVSAQVTETRAFAPAASLRVDSAAGDITVTATDVQQIEVEMVKTAWGANQSEAEEAARALTVVVEETAEGVKLTFRPPEEIVLMESRGGADTVKFNIRVPARTGMRLETDMGDVSLTGTVGRAALRVNFGAITAIDLSGDLIAFNQNGAISLTRVDAGADNVGARSNFGDITAEELRGGNFDLASVNGTLTIQGLHATGSVSFDTNFGAINAESVSGASLTATTSNGKVTIQGGEFEGALEASSDFGDVEVNTVTAGNYKLHSQNGSLTLTGAANMLTLKTDFGGISVTEARNAVLDLRTNNGKIRFSGSLDPQAEHTIQSEFGDIELSLPEDSAFDLTLETQFGRIKSELPVTLSGGLEEKHWEAVLNGGGPRLSVTTQNGNIDLRVLSTNS